MNDPIGLTATAQAAVATVESKRRSTLTARAMLILGRPVIREVRGSAESFDIDGQRFGSIEEAEDFLDAIGGEE